LETVRKREREREREKEKESARSDVFLVPSAVIVTATASITVLPSS